MKLIFTLVLFSSLTITLFGQTYLGVSTSNYAGVMGVQLQPASFVDGRFVFDLNIAGFKIGRAHV